MVFDDLLDIPVIKPVLESLPPKLEYLDQLLDQRRIHTVISFLIYAIQFMLAYWFLILFMGMTNILSIYFYGSFFIGIGAFVDQLLNPDENSRSGYMVLLAVYYVLYKFVIFGFAIYFILKLFHIEYQLHYLEEILPGLTIFVFWAVGQKIGFHLQMRKLMEKAEGGVPLTDIDKLKIFLTQVHRRSFLKMIIQAGQAKFLDTSKLDFRDTEEFKEKTRLISLNMSNFLKFLKLKDLPQNKYVTFKQIVEIDFSKNKISRFSTYLFKIFPNVRSIDLSNNKIKEFTEQDQIELLNYTGNVVVNFDNNPIFT